MANPLVHWEICVGNLAKGKEFYKGVFDWNVEESGMGNYGMISTGEEPEGGIFEAEGEMKPYVTVYFKVDDIDAYLDKAESLGAHVIQRKKLISKEFGYYGMFADPDGNVIGLWSRE